MIDRLFDQLAEEKDPEPAPAEAPDVVLAGDDPLFLTFRNRGRDR